MVLRSSLGVAVAGVAIGLVASAWVRALLEGMIPGVRSRDPLSLAVPDQQTIQPTIQPAYQLSNKPIYEPTTQTTNNQPTN